ncbi:SRPBCC family protein [Solimonas sp. SE-A11]|uniref:SRPBCC family protein n=1 Tax=Solimonas sp. SE-A11 TaxID=3054954 RepID=UPI00259C7626|nr:SRPBCC family protein [Solimonas sp. SE-A11]MDM4771229.1 SRPBCC family protein [Solimonas sp. SE-A11]
MDVKGNADPAPMSRTSAERVSDREIVVTCTINGPARLVFEAFTTADLFRQWWVPKSLGLMLLSCEIDARVGGKYRLVFRHGDSTMAFYGTYTEVVPYSRLAWTNEESGEDGAVTTASFEEETGRTLLVLRDRYATKEAADAGMASGAYDGMSETFGQLDELLAG